MTVAETFCAMFIVSVVTGTAGYLFFQENGTTERHSTQLTPTPGRLRAEARRNLEEQAHEAWKVDHDPAKAEALFQESLRLYGESDFLQAELAELLDEQGKTKEAYVFYQKLAYNPLAATEKSPSRILRYGELSEAFHLPHEAMAAYQKVVADQDGARQRRLPEYISLTPPHPVGLGTWHSLAQLSVAAHSGNAALIRQAVEREPSLAIGHLYLGATLIEVPPLRTEGKAELQKAVTLSRGNMAIKAVVEAAGKRVP